MVTATNRDAFKRREVSIPRKRRGIEILVPEVSAAEFCHVRLHPV